MNRHNIRLLQHIKSNPCVTITLPTHRTAPENRQDPIRVKNLVKQALDRLAGEFSKPEIELLAIRFDQVVEEIDYQHVLDGLALFVNRDFSQAVYLPFTLKERVVLGESFFTRDLVFAMNRTPRYWIIVLSEKPTRLYEGTRDHLVEVQDGGFPLIHEGPGGEQPLPGGFGVRKSAYRDERHRQFFRQIDRALTYFLASDPLPLAVVGVERYLAFFDEVTTNKESILATLTGSHDNTSLHELGKLVWPLVKANLDEQRNKVLSKLDKAIAERKFVSTIGEAWRLAIDGRGRVLLVEEDFHFPARVDETGRHLLPAGDAHVTDGLDDAVDEIIETVLNKQGQVVFLDNGQLEAHQRIALILRY